MKRTSKTFLLIGTTLLSFSLSFAERGVCVYSFDGGKAYINLAEEPSITYDKENAIIKTSTKEVMFPIADILKIKIEDYFPENIISVNQDSSQETIFSLKGDLILDFSSSPSGVYIVKRNRESYLMYKKQ